MAPGPGVRLIGVHGATGPPGQTGAVVLGPRGGVAAPALHQTGLAGLLDLGRHRHRGHRGLVALLVPQLPVLLRQ